MRWHVAVTSAQAHSSPRCSSRWRRHCRRCPTGRPRSSSQCRSQHQGTSVTQRTTACATRWQALRPLCSAGCAQSLAAGPGCCGLTWWRQACRSCARCWRACCLVLWLQGDGNSAIDPLRPSVVGSLETMLNKLSNQVKAVAEQELQSAAAASITAATTKQRQHERHRRCPCPWLWCSLCVWNRHDSSFWLPLTYYHANSSAQGGQLGGAGSCGQPAGDAAAAAAPLRHHQRVQPAERHRQAGAPALGPGPAHAHGATWLCPPSSACR
mmetsp:Transcript_20775/g.52763  ORF Transcript_20775/g.52763 Transcript_20775/m.52763 type:complete len:268 (-) Transcript_20775:2226-3029(-)